jgi:hypothetical protein
MDFTYYILLYTVIFFIIQIPKLIRGRRLILFRNDNVQVAGVEVLITVVRKGSIFWDITPSGLLKVNRRFGEYSTLMMEEVYSSETSLDFQRLHSVVSQKIELLNVQVFSVHNEVSILVPN